MEYILKFCSGLISPIILRVSFSLPKIDPYQTEDVIQVRIVLERKLLQS